MPTQFLCLQVLTYGDISNLKAFPEQSDKNSSTSGLVAKFLDMLHKNFP